MSIIKTISQLTEQLGNAVAVSADNKKILPYVEKAELQYIRKAIGNEQADLLSGIGPFTGLNLQLLGLIQKSLAFYALYEWSAFSMGRQTDNGLEESGAGGTGNMAGRQWVYNDRKLQAIKNGAFFLDQAIQLLLNNRGTFTTWAASTAGQASFKLFIQNGTQMGELLPQTYGSHTLYLSLLPYFKKIEARELPEVVGNLLITNIKARRGTNTNTAADLAILPYLSDFVANYGYADALEHMEVIQDDKGLRVSSEFDGINTKAAPSIEAIIRLKQLANNNKIEAAGRLNAFLVKNALDYPDYTTSTAYRAEVTAVGYMKNTEYENVFRLR